MPRRRPDDPPEDLNDLINAAEESRYDEATGEYSVITTPYSRLAVTECDGHARPAMTAAYQSIIGAQIRPRLDRPQRADQTVRPTDYDLGTTVSRSFSSLVSITETASARRAR